MTMTDDRSPAEIEREIEAERTALARSLEDLQRTFSPETILNQVTGYAKDNGGEIANGLVEQVKRNPVAAAVTGVGLAWLIAGARKPSYAADRRHGDRDYALREPRVASGVASDQPEFATRRDLRPDEDDVSGGFDAARPAGGASPSWDDRTYPSPSGLATTGDPMTGAYEGYDDRLRSTSGSDDDGPSAMERAKGAVAGAWGSAKGSAASAYEGAREGAHSAGDSTSSAFANWRDSARGKYYTAKARTGDYRSRAYASSAELRARLSEGTESMSEQARARVMRARAAAMEAQGTLERTGREYAAKTGRMYDEQPLVFGGIALAVGALIGAGLPRTESEDRAFGAYRDDLFDEAQRVFEEESAKVQAVAGAALDEAKAVADETMSDVKARASGAIDDAKSRAEGAIDTAKAKSEAALKEADAKASEAKANVPTGKAAVDAAEAKATEAGERVANAAKEEAKKQDLGGSVR